MEDFEPRIVGFTCRWCAYQAADTAGTSRKKYPPNIGFIRVQCTGRVSPSLILKAFARGADGVLVAGCHPGECHYERGNLYARRRVTELKPFLEAIGLGGDRLRLEWIGASDVSKVPKTVKSFTETVKKLGPSPLREHT